MSEETKSKPDTSSDDGKKADGTDAGAGTQTAKTEDAPKSFTQDELNNIISKRLADQKAKFDNDKAEEERKRQESADKEAGKHQQLAVKFEKERDDAVATAKATQEKLDALSESLTAIVDTELKALPEEVRATAPKSLEDRLEWLPSARKLAEKLTGEPKPGNSRGPKPAGETPQDVVQSIYERKRASGQYSR
jgi:hypothetical protein